MSLAEFEVFRNLLIEVNKSLFYLTATMINIVSEREVSKDYKRKVSLNELKLIPCLLRVALGTVNTVVSEKAL